MKFWSRLRGVDIVVLVLWIYALSGEVQTEHDRHLCVRAIGVGAILAYTLQWLSGMVGHRWRDWRQTRRK
ncbi:hypothetical protein [Chromobacterium sp. ASV23]|uniref:hypothetical protein n=1 Tax=Chromobacterium sp. ASV23 TaxID=2795110 RepID=UPI0018EC51DE|nr:hypothetical protein [Chromobacterium sp. ASV23]